jgi:arylsulfatase A-like enzyme
LIIYDPRDEQGRDEHKFASHMDLFPTVVSLLGGAKGLPTLGEPLSTSGEGRVMVTGRYDNIGMFTPQGYLVHSFSQVIENTVAEPNENPLAFLLLSLEHTAFSAVHKHRW